MALVPLDLIAHLISDKEPRPNKFTRAMGELIQEARSLCFRYAKMYSCGKSGCIRKVISYG
jgi:hypothetical protein